MKKKSIALPVLLCLVSSIATAAPSLTAIGVYGSLAGSQTGSTGTGFGLSLKMGSFPVIGLEYNLNGPQLGLAADYWVMNETLGNNVLSYYLGVGAFGGIAFTSPTAWDIGLRVPIGLQLYPLRKLEFFFEAAPMLHLIPAPVPDVAASIGLRIHF